ncbi:hypothetical protein [Pantoea eucalypti]|jgi:hypothetical protein|uniref:hypothetical protein n=1 Tax=Pantoea eucalypti TaxID=470933 RepID=UPI00301C06AE
MARNGTGNRNYRGYTLRHIIAPYGMRKINGFNENTWEFFNRQYDVIGLPFTLARKPSLAQQNAVSNRKLSETSNKIFFHDDSNHGTPEYWQRIDKVTKWKLKEGMIEQQVKAGLPPHSYGVIQEED